MENEELRVVRAVPASLVDHVVRFVMKTLTEGEAAGVSVETMVQGFEKLIPVISKTAVDAVLAKQTIPHQEKFTPEQLADISVTVQRQSQKEFAAKLLFGLELYRADSHFLM